MHFKLGMALNINDECVGEFTQMTDDRIFIESECFRGWATKAEIEAAIKSARPARYRRTRQRSRPTGAVLHGSRTGDPLQIALR